MLGCFAGVVLRHPQLRGVFRLPVFHSHTTPACQTFRNHPTKCAGRLVASVVLLSKHYCPLLEIHEQLILQCTDCFGVRLVRLWVLVEHAGVIRATHWWNVGRQEPPPHGDAPVDAFEPLCAFARPRPRS